MGASEVFKNQSFKGQLFSSSQKKIPQIENHGLILMLLLFFINKMINLRQFSEKNLNKWALNHVVLMYRVCKDPRILLASLMVWYTCSASPYRAASTAGLHHAVVKRNVPIQRSPLEYTGVFIYCAYVQIIFRIEILPKFQYLLNGRMKKNDF